MAKFIVVFKDDAPQEAIDKQADEINANGGSVGTRFDSVTLKGFSAEIPEAYLLTLQNNIQQGCSQISYIEPDSEVHI